MNSNFLIILSVFVIYYIGDKMPIRPIVSDRSQLQKSCEYVKEGEDVSQIILDLKDTFETKRAFGISANQIGYNKRISYIKIPKKVNADKTVEYEEVVLINAKIVEKDTVIQVKGESCLSFPGLGVTTKRYVFITVEYLDEKLQSQTVCFQDVIGIAVQHECDHQNGVTLFSKKWSAR